MPGSGGGAPNPESDNEIVLSVTDSEKEHERKVEETRKERDKLTTHELVLAEMELPPRATQLCVNGVFSAQLSP